MSYRCSIHDTTKPIFCKTYPSSSDWYFFEKCQYIENGEIITSSLSESEQQSYCMDCGLCCFANIELIRGGTIPTFNSGSNSGSYYISTDNEDEWIKDTKCKYLMEDSE